MKRSDATGPRVTNDGHTLEIEPHKLRRESPGHSVLNGALRYVRMGRKAGRSAGSPRPARAHLQRCAVQVRYTKGGSVGKWYSHGAYIAREAKHRENGQGLGFSADRSDVPIAETLVGWRKGKDELFFRIIISPEFGDRLDLEKHTRDTLEQMEFDLGTKLEWVAAVHRNTDNPHVHVVVRGKREDGSTLRIDPAYIKEGLRERAQEAATCQLGPRTELDILAAQRREIEQSRWTGLDRLLEKRAVLEGGILSVSVGTSGRLLRGLQQATETHLDRRLHRLEQMGLARYRANNQWEIDPGWQKSLRTMQKTGDRLKITAEYGVLASDPRLPFRAVRPSQLESAEGKVLVHSQDEHSGSNFMLLESVTGEILRVPQVAEIAKARQSGQLNTGHYVRIERLPVDKSSGKKYLITDDGDADAVLRDASFWQTHGKRLAGQIPAGWQGWLGQMHAAALTAQAQQLKTGLRR